MSGPDAAQPNEQNLHKDPETGEMISKSWVSTLSFRENEERLLTREISSELKRRQKQRERQAAKAAKAASAPAAATKPKNAEEGEEELNPNVRIRWSGTKHRQSVANALL